MENFVINSYTLTDLTLLTELFISSAILQMTFFGFFKSTKKLNVSVEKSYYYIGILVVILGSILCLNEDLLYYRTLNNSIQFDFLSFLTKQTILITSIFFLVIITACNRKERLYGSFEYVILILVSILGLLFLCSANDLITAYLAIELQSVAFYLMAAFKKDSNYSIESGLKYFIIGALSSALFLFGSSILYGCFGSLYFNDLHLLSDLLHSDCSSKLDNCKSISESYLNCLHIFENISDIGYSIYSVIDKELLNFYPFIIAATLTSKEFFEASDLEKVFSFDTLNKNPEIINKGFELKEIFSEVDLRPHIVSECLKGNESILYEFCSAFISQIKSANEITVLDLALLQESYKEDFLQDFPDSSNPLLLKKPDEWLFVDFNEFTTAQIDNLKTYMCKASLSEHIRNIKFFTYANIDKELMEFQPYLIPLCFVLEEADESNFTGEPLSFVKLSEIPDLVDRIFSSDNSYSQIDLRSSLISECSKGNNDSNLSEFCRMFYSDIKTVDKFTVLDLATLQESYTNKYLKDLPDFKGFPLEKTPEEWLMLDLSCFDENQLDVLRIYLAEASLPLHFEVAGYFTYYLMEEEFLNFQPYIIAMIFAIEKAAELSYSSEASIFSPLDNTTAFLQKKPSLKEYFSQVDLRYFILSECAKGPSSNLNMFCTVFSSEIESADRISVLDLKELQENYTRMFLTSDVDFNLFKRIFEDYFIPLQINAFNIDGIFPSNLDPLIAIGFVLISCSIFIKLAAAPFHYWSLDVYEGSPNATTFFFAVVPKIALFVLLFRICYVSLNETFLNYQVYFFLIAVLSIFVGSFGGLEQRKIKTLLAYSSVSHTGYLLLSFSTCTFDGMQMLFYYLIIFMITGLCFWSSYMLIKQKNAGYDNKHNKELGDLTLLKSSNPALALIMAITLFSMAGIPPMVGFLAKIGIFSVTMKSSAYIIALVSILFSVVATFYYIRVVKVLYFENVIVGKLYEPITTKSSSILLSILSLSIIFLTLNPTVLYLLCHKALLFLN